jgi:hypothetical protein
MNSDEAIVAILNDTVIALSKFDFAKLQSLEREILNFVGSGIKFDEDCACLIMRQRYVLEILLKNCEVNLNTLKRLNSRDAGNQWAR